MPVSPIYILADSQLLFWRNKNGLFLKTILNHISSNNPLAAYVGASNGDEKAYFQIFESAMEQIGINNCQMISMNFTKADKDNIKKADIILLAGGDPKNGWDIFTKHGVDRIVCNRYREGAVVIGVSAGAVQLGSRVLQENTAGQNELFETFNLVPYIIDVHDEKSDWSKLERTIEVSDKKERGLGVRAGSGFIFYPNHAIEPVRYNLVELTHGESGITPGLLFVDENIQPLSDH